MTGDTVRPVAPQQVLMENQGRVRVSGEADVDSFDDTTRVVYSALVELTVRGEVVQIQRLNVETGDLSLSGTVDSLTYAEKTTRRGGWKRLFR